MTDFHVTDHGTIWQLHAISEPALDRISEISGECFVSSGDWRPMWHLCQELHAEGYSFECSTRTAQNLIETGRPW